MLAFCRDFFPEGAKSIVFRISIVMLIFLLFSDLILRGIKVSRGGGGGLLWKKASMDI